MTHRSLFAIGVLTCALALPVAASAQHGARIDIPEVPGNLVVEDGNVPYLQTRAYGTQNYICLPSATGVAWKLYGPQRALMLEADRILKAIPGRQGRDREANRRRLASLDLLR
ncbi:MAG: DUF3455 domain-containing protein [Cyanobacteria bacterium]|nr:DUF3455 domain-containing protein [Cyanobacteriota bacterium]